jgi:hypothetical protein
MLFLYQGSPFYHLPFNRCFNWFLVYFCVHPATVLNCEDIFASPFWSKYFIDFNSQYFYLGYCNLALGSGEHFFCLPIWAKWQHPQ